MKVVSISDKLGEDDRVLAEDAATALRTWLAMAEGGEIISVAIAGEMRCGNVATGHSAAAQRYCVIGALDTLKQEIIAKNLEQGE